MTQEQIRDKVEALYVKDTGKFAFLDENKLDDRYIRWLEIQVMNNFVLDPVVCCTDKQLKPNRMKLICKCESLDNEGGKIMKFTKGNVYEAIENDEDGWYITDDNGNREEFWNIDIMFKSID